MPGWDDGRAEFYRREVQGVRDVDAHLRRDAGDLRTARQRVGAADLPGAPRPRDPHVPGRGRSRRHRRSAVLLRRDAERVQDAVESHPHGLERRRESRQGKGGFHVDRTSDCARVVAARSASTIIRTSSCRPSSGMPSISGAARIPIAPTGNSRGRDPRPRPRRHSTTSSSTSASSRNNPACASRTATELKTLYEDAASSRTFAPADLQALARSVQKEITFQKFDRYALSSADVFGLLTDAMAGIHRRARRCRQVRRSRRWTDRCERSARRQEARDRRAFRWTAFAGSGARYRGILSNRAPGA